MKHIDTTASIATGISSTRSAQMRQLRDQINALPPLSIFDAYELLAAVIKVVQKSDAKQSDIVTRVREQLARM